MALLRDLRPLNQESEKAKFFQDTSYNPQFVYVRQFSEQEIGQYGLPNLAYFEHAKKMLIEHGLPDYSSTNPASAPEIASEVFDLVEHIGLPKISVHFESDLSSPIMFNKDSLHFRTPILLSLSDLKSKLDHEIQTHYLRRYNQSLQSWNLQSSLNSPKSFRMTEEGLANLHSYIDIGSPPVIFKKSYVSYFVSYLAQELSFAELYSELRKLGCGEQHAWNLILQQKRGLTDTSQPGGYPKSHLYLEGLVMLCRWMIGGGDPKLLYAGRISLKDVTKLPELPISQDIIYPSFFSDMSMYIEKVNRLAEINHIENLPEVE
jgi:hypothetical protein